MDNQRLLSISAFAKIAGTTRRTLIFYDQKGIFKPYKIKDNVPMINQKYGSYVVVKVKNTESGIGKGLAAIRAFIQKNNLRIGNDLWQFNIGLNIVQLGLTKDGILAYEIL